MSPLQGPPASRPVRGLSTLRSFESPLSPVPTPLRQSSQAADALETTASATFSEETSSILQGAKCNANQPYQDSTVIPRGKPHPCARSLAGRAAKLRVGIGCDSLWPDEPSTKSQEPSLQGTALPWLYLAAIPPGLVSFRLTQVSLRHEQLTLFSSVATCWLQLTTPSGRPGYGPSLPLRPVGADCNRHPGAVLRLTPTPCIRAVGHRLRGSLRFNDVEVVLVLVVKCMFACTDISRINISAALTGESTVSAWPQAASGVFPSIQR